MNKQRLRRGAFWGCMVLGAGLAAALALSIPGQPAARFASRTPASTPGPMLGFAADSVFNTGTAEQLEAFPGIGEVLAARVIEGRTEYGPYRLPEDLLLIRGVGPKKLAEVLAVLAEPLVDLADGE